MTVRSRCSVLAALLGALAACGGGGGGADLRDVPDDAAPDPGPPADLPGDEGLPDLPSDLSADLPGDPGTDGAPDPGGDGGPRLEPPLLLLEKTVAGDTGTFDDDPRLPLDPRQGFRHPLRVSSCETVAALFRDFTPRPGDLLDASLVVVEAPLSGDPTLPRGFLAGVTGVAAPPPVAGTLVFSESDGQCHPRVWRAADRRVGFDQWIRKPSGQWEPAEVLLDLATPLGAEPTALRTVAIDADRTGRAHLLFVAVLPGGAERWVHAHVDGGLWEIEQVPPAPFLSEAPGAAYAFDNEGRVNLIRPGDDGVTWAVLGEGGWTREVAVPPPEADVALDLPDLALGAYDVPQVAYRRIVLLDEGLWQSTRLEVATRVDGNWTSAVVADRNGAYTGRGVDRVTGGWPRLATDDAGRTRVAFLDAALRRTGDGLGALYGGPRLGVRTPAGWDLSTLLAHPGGSGASSEYDVAEPAALAVAPGGDAFAALVVERRRPKDLPPGQPGEATWRLWLVRGNL